MKPIKNTSGRKPINETPMSASERKTRQRAKLKEAGGKQFSVTISGELMAWVNMLVKASKGRKTESGILLDVIEDSLKRRVNLYLGAIQIKEAGGSIQDIQRFYEDNREKIINVNDYLPNGGIL